MFQVFPLDFVLFGGLIAYLFATSLNGLVALGVRVLWRKMYDIREQQTSPIALLTGAWWLMLVVLAFSFEITTLSPQYAMFGSQYYAVINNQTGAVGPRQRCTLTEAGLLPKQCVMTQVGVILTKYTLKLPWIAAISLGCDLLFSFCAVLLTILLRSFILFHFYLSVSRVPAVKRRLWPQTAEKTYLFD